MAESGGFLSSALQLAKQAAAGAALPFSSPGMQTKPVDYTPGIVKYAPKLAAALGYNIQPDVRQVTTQRPPVFLDVAPAGLYGLYNAVAPAINLKTADIPYLNRATKRVNEADQGINDRLHIKDPSNTAETAARIAGGMLIPGPTAVAGVTRGGNILQKAGRVAAETVMPLRQGGLGTAIAATAIGTGLSEGADVLDNNSEYKSIYDITHPAGVVRPELRDKPADQYMTPETIQAYNHAVETGDVQTQDELLGLVHEAQQQDHAASYLPPEPFWQTKEAKELAAAGAMAAAGILGARVISKTKAKLMGSSTLVGQDAPEHLTDLSTKATGAAVQNDHAIRNATAIATKDKGRMIGQSQQLAQWNAKLDTVTNPAIHSKQVHFAQTGELPNSSTTTTPLGPMLDAIEKGLQPAEYDLLRDGLVAGTALDDFRRTGSQASFKTDVNGNPVSVADIQHLHDLVQNDPKLSMIADGIRKHYRDQLDYLEEHGVISSTQKQAFIDKRPNFVHLSKNEAPDLTQSMWSQGDIANAAGDRLSLLGSRTDVEGAGIKAGAAADPIAELSNQWANVIKQVEIGRVKKQWLEFADQSPELSQWVKKLPLGVTPEGDINHVHTVFENGMPHNYYIKDPALSSALNFQPFAQNNSIAGAMNVLRRNFEYFTTGPGNPFFAPVAASYDTFTGMALRPKDYNLGVLNEILAHINPKLGIGAADPTAIISAPIGAVRHGLDTLVGAMGRGLSTELQAGKGMFLDTLGPQVTQALETKLSNMYLASIKSQMEEAGVANAGLIASARPDRVGPALNEVAPLFAKGVARRALRDALQGKFDVAQVALARSHYAFEATRAASLARLYSGVMQSIHEGFRYQAYATNLPRVTSPEMAEMIASQTRRIAADIGQHGAGQLAQGAIQSAAYANAGIQSLAQFGRMFKAQPITFTTNAMGALLGLASLYYGPALISKDHRDGMRKRTEEQRMTAFETFGGLEVKVPPEFRPVWGSMIAILDDASGLNKVDANGEDHFDPNFAKAIQSWLDNGASEPGQQDINQNIKEGLWGLMPFTTGSSPVVNAIAAAGSGLDISYSRYTGQPQAVLKQSIDPLGGEGLYTDDAISARYQKAIEDVAGTMLSGYIRAGLDIGRALKDHGDNEDEALKVALSRVVDTAAKQTGPGSVIFGNYERRQSASDGEWKLYQAKKQGIKAATEVLNKDILTPFTDGKDPRSATMSLLDVADIQRNQALMGTALLPIGTLTAQYMKMIQPTLDQTSKIQKSIDDINNQKTTTIEDRNKQINALIEQRKELVKVDNNHIRQAEDAIRAQIGDPTFSYQDLPKHLDRYKKMPWPPAPVPTLPPDAPPASVQ